MQRTVKQRGYGDLDLNIFKDNDGFCLYGSKNKPLIILPGAPRSALEIGTLAHEAVHAVNHIFEWLEQPTDGEIFAYSVGAVVRETLKAVRKKS